MMFPIQGLVYVGTRTLPAGTLLSGPGRCHIRSVGASADGHDCSAMSYRMIGMPIDGVLIGGIWTVVMGLVVAFFGLVSTHAGVRRRGASSCELHSMQNRLQKHLTNLFADHLRTGDRAGSEAARESNATGIPVT
jgi:hypothetical protein